MCISALAFICMNKFFSVRPVDQQKTQLTLKTGNCQLHSNEIFLRKGVDILTREARLAMESCKCLQMLAGTCVIKYNITILAIQPFHIFIILCLKGEMYEGKWYPSEKNLIHFLEEFSNIFLPLQIKVSFLKPQKSIFFQLISRNGTYGLTFSVNIWRFWRTKHVT